MVNSGGDYDSSKGSLTMTNVEALLAL